MNILSLFKSCNHSLFSAPNNSTNMYSLTWTCKFPNNNDTYYFAHCYPYTYSDLQVKYPVDFFFLILIYFLGLS
jgi:hypothetical protein